MLPKRAAFLFLAAALSHTACHLASGQQPRQLHQLVRRVDPPGIITRLVFSPDGRHLAVDTELLDRESGLSRARITIYDTSTWKVIATLQDEGVQGYSPDGRFMATIHGLPEPNANGRLSFYSVPAYRRRATLPRQVASGEFSHRGSLLLTERYVGHGETKDSVFEVWDFPSWRRVNQLPSRIGQASWWRSKDRLIATSILHDKARQCLIDARKGRVTQTFPTAFEATRLAPNGGWAVGYVRGKLELGVWEMRTMKQIHTLTERGKVNDWDISPDGKWIATAGDEWDTRLWDPRTGRKAYLLADPTASEPEFAVAFSPDGKYLVSGGKQDLRVWQVPNH